MKVKRFRLFCCLLVLILSLSVLAGCADTPEDPDPGKEPGNAENDENEYEEREMLSKNLFVFTTQEDYDQGLNRGTEVSAYGNGAITLEASSQSGTYTSPIIKTPPLNT